MQQLKHLTWHDQERMMNYDDYLITEQVFNDISVKSGCHLKQRNSCFCAPSIHVGVISHGNRCRTPATVVRVVIIMFCVIWEHPSHFCHTSRPSLTGSKKGVDVILRFFPDATEEPDKTTVSWCKRRRKKSTHQNKPGVLIISRFLSHNTCYLPALMRVAMFITNDNAVTKGCVCMHTPDLWPWRDLVWVVLKVWYDKMWSSVCFYNLYVTTESLSIHL